MNYTYEVEPTDVVGGVLAGFGVYTIVMLALCILLIVSMYKVFKKAGRKGWEALIPIYNFVVMIQIAELPMWYIVLYFIPFANFYAMFKIYIEFAHKFGKSTGFGIASVFFSFICFPILAFGDAQYQGSIPSNNGYNPYAVPNNNMQPTQNMGMNYNQNIGMNNVSQTQNLGVNYNQNVGMENVAQNNVAPNNFNSNASGFNNQVNSNVEPAIINPVTPINVETNNQSMGMDQINVAPAPQITEPTPLNENIAPVAPTIEPAVQETQSVSPVINEPQATPNESVQTPKKFCPNCGNQVDQNDAICFMCGNQF